MVLRPPSAVYPPLGMRFRRSALGDVSLVVLQGVVELPPTDTPTDTIGGVLFRRKGRRMPRLGTILRFHFNSQFFLLARTIAGVSETHLAAAHEWLHQDCRNRSWLAQSGVGVGMTMNI